MSDEVTCNMLGQDAILRLGLVIDGNRCYIKHSHNDKGEEVYINSVDFEDPYLEKTLIA